VRTEETTEEVLEWTTPHLFAAARRQPDLDGEEREAEDSRILHLKLDYIAHRIELGADDASVGLPDDDTLRALRAATVEAAGLRVAGLSPDERALHPRICAALSEAWSPTLGHYERAAIDRVIEVFRGGARLHSAAQAADVVEALTREPRTRRTNNHRWPVSPNIEHSPWVRGLRGVYPHHRPRSRSERPDRWASFLLAGLAASCERALDVDVAGGITGWVNRGRSWWKKPPKPGAKKRITKRRIYIGSASFEETARGYQRAFGAEDGEVEALALLVAFLLHNKSAETVASILLAEGVWSGFVKSPEDAPPQVFSLEDADSGSPNRHRKTRAPLDPAWEEGMFSAGWRRKLRELLAHRDYEDATLGPHDRHSDTPSALKLNAMHGAREVARDRMAFDIGPTWCAVYEILEAADGRPLRPLLSALMAAAKTPSAPRRRP